MHFLLEALQRNTDQPFQMIAIGGRGLAGRGSQAERKALRKHRLHLTQRLTLELAKQIHGGMWKHGSYEKVASQAMVVRRWSD